MRRLTALAVAAIAVSACGSSAAPSETVTWKVDQDPFRITIASGGKTLLEQDAHARFRYQLAATGVQHFLTKVKAVSGSAYTVATDERGRSARVTIRRASHGVRIRLTLQPAQGVAQVYDAFRARGSEHFMGGGERGDTLDLRGQILQNKVSDTCSYAPAPFFVSSAGYGVSLATDAVSALAFPRSPGGTGCTFGDTPSCAFPPLPDRTEVCVKGAELAENVYAGSPAQILAARAADVGRQVLPPPSQLALIKWRDEYSGPADVLEDVTRLQRARIPLGWVLVDNPWETCVGTLKWDRRRFPDPAGLARAVHARGVKLMLWVSPDAYCAAGYPPSALIKTTVASELDLTRPAVRTEFTSRLRAAFSVGVDGVKGDRADEGDLEPRGATLHNRYPLLFAQAVVGVLRSLHGNDFATIFRAITPGEQKLIHGMWAGDQPGDYVGIQRAVRLGATAGLAGYSVWGSDVGGYSSAGLTAELFARWAQLGAVSPVFEVGGVGPNATPWRFGETGMTALRDAAVLHYELFPYFYDLLRRGRPVLEPLAYGYPDDEDAWKADLELLVGPSLLAAPVTGPGTTPSVYLPEGRWVDLHTGETVEGGRSLTRETPLTELPLYARAGAVLPFNLRTPQAPWWGLNELVHPGRAGFLATDGAKLALRSQPRDVQLFVPAPERPGAVKLGGRSVAFTWVAGPLPGVVVRLRGPNLQGRIELSGS